MLTDAMSRLGLPPEAVVEPAPDGATGTVWRVRTATASYTMRLASSSRLTDGRLAAIAAARDAGLPAPELIRRASTPDGEAVLLSWLPGGPMYGSLRRDPTRARRWGQLTGELQRRLHEIDAPDAVIDVRAEGLHPFDAGRSIVGLPEGRALLHLDWHPLNLLVDEREERICGIVDWDNARRGHPLLDLARTHSLLTVEPSLADMPASLRARLGDFRDGWADGYGLATRTIPRACHLWAGRVGRPRAPLRRRTRSPGPAPSLDGGLGGNPSARADRLSCARLDGRRRLAERPGADGPDHHPRRGRGRHLGLDTTSPRASRSSRVRIDGNDHGAGNGIQAWRRRGRPPRSARAAREPGPPSCQSG